MRALIAALTVLTCGAGAASAQVLSIEFQDGRVRLVAENVPVSQILDEWSRVGGTKIVNGARIPGGPVTLQLLDVPERQALDVVLRGAAGYMVASRDTSASDASVFDRILVLPTTAVTPNAPPPPPPVARRPPQPGGDDFALGEAQADAPAQPTPQPPQPLERLPRGRVQSGLDLPNASPEELAVGEGVVDAEEPEPGQENAPPVPTPANPFGVVPGSARPGVITPVAPPRPPDGERPRGR